MQEFLLRRKVLYVTFVVMLLMFSLPRTAFSQADSSTSNIFVQFQWDRFVPCANGGSGEWVWFSGTVHHQGHTTTNENRVITNFVSLQPHGVTGLGQITGDVYHLVGTSRVSQSVELNGGASTLTFINNLSMIARGPGNDLHVHQNIHITVNANGEASTQVRHSNIECF